MNKRTNYLTWDEYFMGVATLSSMRSKDPKTQVGCCIVDPDHRISSVGYNGLPRGCNDDEYPWNRKEEGMDDLDTKYPYVVHAELNAILNYKGESLKGSTLYVTMFPCNECAKAIIQSGISKVVYLDDTYRKKPSGRAADRMFQSAGVTVEQFHVEGTIQKIRYLDFSKNGPSKEELRKAAQETPEFRDQYFCE